jgi:hypothetical protein
MAQRRCVVAVVLFALLAMGRATESVARADGAFPTAQAILLDATRPADLVLSTNFGLVASHDGGESWSYGCETTLTSNAYQYLRLAPASSRTWALSTAGLVFSDDEGCSWAGAGGALAGAFVTDYFVSRGDPTWVVAIAAGVGGNGASLYGSRDGGTTFTVIPLYRLEGDGALDGVEITGPSGATLYVVARPAPDHHVTLALSRDAGQTWSSRDLAASLAAAVGDDAAVTLAGVDKDDDQRIYLRVRANANGVESDGVALTTDGGATLTVPLSVPGALFNAFLQRADGTLLIAGRDADGASLAYLSRDRGATFVPWNLGKLRVTGLAERGTTLFAATDNFAEGTALASSDDAGNTWKARMSFDRISAVQSCLRVACASDCEKKAEIGLFPAATCSATPSTDAGGAPGSSQSGCALAGVEGAASNAERWEDRPHGAWRRQARGPVRLEEPPNGSPQEGALPRTGRYAESTIVPLLLVALACAVRRRGSPRDSARPRQG